MWPVNLVPGANVTGTAGTSGIVALTTPFSALYVANLDDTNALYLMIVPKGASAPTVAADNFHVAVAKQTSEYFGVCHCDVYAYSVGGDYNILPLNSQG